jgi:hypothetical protein
MRVAHAALDTPPLQDPGAECARKSACSVHRGAAIHTCIVMFAHSSRSPHISQTVKLCPRICFHSSTRRHSARPPPPPRAVAISGSAEIQLKKGFFPAHARARSGE